MAMTDDTSRRKLIIICAIIVVILTSITIFFVVKNINDNNAKKAAETSTRELEAKNEKAKQAKIDELKKHIDDLIKENRTNDGENSASNLEEIANTKDQIRYLENN